MLTQIRSNQCSIHYTCNFVQTAVRGKIGLMVLRLQNRRLFIEAFCDADHEACAPTNRNGADMHRHAVARLVTKEYLNIAGLTLVHGSGQWANYLAKNALMFIAMH